jgi:hypothetical protein
VQSRHKSAFFDDFIMEREEYYSAAAGANRAAAKILYHSALYGSIAGGKADVDFEAGTGMKVPQHVQDSSFLSISLNKNKK